MGAGRRAENEPESRRLQNRPITTPYSNGDRLANWGRQERRRRSGPGNAIDLRPVGGFVSSPPPFRLDDVGLIYNSMSVLGFFCSPEGK